MKNSAILLLLGVMLFQMACEGDYRQRAIGENHEIYVIMDEEMHESATAEALNMAFNRVLIHGMSTELYRLNFRDFSTNEELDQLRKFKNIIIATPIDAESNTGQLVGALLGEGVKERVRSGESFAFPLEDHWYRDQWALILTSSSDSLLASKIERAGHELRESAVHKELARWEESVFRRAEQTELSQDLWDSYGWNVRMQHDYIQTVDTLNVVTFRRYLPDNDRWIWGWWQDGVENPDFVDQEWINATRDSLMEIYVRGERERSFVTTEYRRPITTSEISRDDRIQGWETLGTWRMTADLMGGPFVNFTYHDPETDRLFMVEYGQFAPGVGKRRFIQQFRAMGRTFEADSSFSVTDYPEDYIVSYPPSP
ncbi:MAG: DUF4837 family protein [Balneolaceae bacterium]